MQRTVTAELTGTVTAPAELVWAIAVARHPGLVEESLELTIDGASVPLRELATRHGGRMHVADPGPTGDLVLRYRAVVEGRHEEQPTDEAELVEYRSPSRYADSDRLAQVAGAHFGGVSGAELADAVADWVYENIAYLTGSSRVTDGASDSYLARSGVCRDFAHLVITFLRARGIPARLAAVYAPGLSPMDFHAVVEAWVEGQWRVLDATRLAPRASLLRIATGRDAADTAFLNVLSGRMELGTVKVTAVVDDELPVEDRASVVHLG
jgi:transglutaminase-like putative cysteine protease